MIANIHTNQAHPIVSYPRYCNRTSLNKSKKKKKTANANILEKKAINDATAATTNPEKDSFKSKRCRARKYSRIINKIKIGYI